MADRRPEPLADDHELDAVDCGNAALNEWLTKYARIAHASRSARVFVTTLEDSADVVGYYALAAASIEREHASRRAGSGQPHQLPAILLARLAVDQDHQGRGLGSSLLQDVFIRILEAAENIGVRVLLVHAKEEAKDWYMRYGFEESPTDPLHLMMVLKDVRRLIEVGP